MAPPTQPLAGTIVPKEVIMLGSVVTISGLVRLSILGFRIFKESEHGEIRKKSDIDSIYLGDWNFSQTISESWHKL
jgi:hypothetical protein